LTFITRAPGMTEGDSMPIRGNVHEKADRVAPAGSFVTQP
jgi:hypothetical protein